MNNNMYSEYLVNRLEKGKGQEIYFDDPFSPLLG